MAIQQAASATQRPSARGYFFKTPWWLTFLFPRRTWKIRTTEKIIYLSFDDGPHPVATPFVLDTLKRYNAHATFFCIGKNVASFPALYQRVLEEGHRTGNHTMDHLNGWKTPVQTYLSNIEMATLHIRSRLFRPPYGRLRGAQAKKLKGWQIVMWDVLSGDFDPVLSKEDCLQAVLRHTNAGSVLVFHDSEKAFDKLTYTLPLVLEHFTKMGFRFEVIPD